MKVRKDGILESFPIEGGNTTDVSIDDGGNTITVDATNLDIRDLTSASDNVECIQDTAADLNVTEASASTIAGDTTSIDGKTPALGQSNKAGSVPVTLATDEDNVNVDVISGVQLDGLTDTELRATPVPVSGTVSIQEPLSVDANGGSLTVDNAGLTELAAVINANELDINIASDGVGLATSAKQLADGHNVTVDNGVGAGVYVRPGTGVSFDVNLQAGDGTDITETGGALDVNIASGSVTADIEGDYVDDSEFVVGTDKGIIVGGVFTTDTIDEDDFGAFKINAKRELFVVQDTAANLNVTEVNSGTIAGDTTSIDGKTPALGQSNKAGSVPVTLANDEDNINVDVVSGVQTDGLTDTELRATAVPVSAATLPLPAGAATSAKQLADGHAVTIDNISTNEVFIRGSQAAGSPVDDEVITVQGITSMTPLAVTESSPISGFATSAKQLADGHNVTIDNGAAGAAVNIQDGGNTITVDGAITNTVLSVVGGGTEATAQRVTIANDSTGVITVDGTVTATPSGTQDVDVTANSIGLATSALQLPDGHNVTVDNASIAVTGTVTANQGTKLGSGSGWRATEYGHTAGLPNYYSNVASTYEIPSSVIVDPVSAALCSVSNAALQTTGDEAHDAVDAGNPVKIGVRAIDYKPDTEDEQGVVVVADDRANVAGNLYGQVVEGVNAKWHTLDAINVVYDDDPTTATSAAVECWNYRYCTLSFDLDSALAPTDITFVVEVSPDGTNWAKLTNNALGNIAYDDTICATEISEAYMFPIAAHSIRVKVIAIGTDGAGKEFEVTNATLYLRN